MATTEAADSRAAIKFTSVTATLSVHIKISLLSMLHSYLFDFTYIIFLTLLVSVLVHSWSLNVMSMAAEDLLCSYDMEPDNM